MDDDDPRLGCFGAIIYAIVFVGLIALSGCATVVGAGETHTMQPDERIVYIEPGGTLIIPAMTEEEEIAERERMGAWWCEDCDELYDWNIYHCWCGRERP